LLGIQATSWRVGAVVGYARLTLLIFVEDVGPTDPIAFTVTDESCQGNLYELALTVVNPDSADSMYVNLIPNGPFATDIQQPASFTARVKDQQTGQTQMYTQADLPHSLQNTPGLPPDTVYVEISWQMDASDWEDAFSGFRSIVPIELLAYEPNPSGTGLPIGHYCVEPVRNCLDPTGIRDQQPSTFEVFPNPAQETLHVHGLPNVPLRYQWLDLTGRVMASGQLQDHERKLSVADLPTGCYLLQMQANDGRSFWQKVVVR